MSIWFDNEKILTSCNSNAFRRNLAFGNAISNNTKIGSAKGFQLTAPNDQNWWYASIKLNTSFKKGQALTISMEAALTEKQSSAGLYKATIYTSDTKIFYEKDAGDKTPLQAGKRSSKTFYATQDSRPNENPVLFVYPGLPGKTGGNTITVKNVKVELGKGATEYIPSFEDLARTEDVSNLQSQIDELKKKLGGG